MLKAFSTLLTIAFLFMVYGFGKMYYAKRAAENYCELIEINSSLSKQESLAKSQSIKVISSQSTNEVLFIFSGFMFSSGVCAIKYTGDAISSKKAYLYVLQ